ncbi:hypothetical protein BRC94_04535 [Halobacteriales archaeon QS_5_70_17]|nr:MAG: hypothetical protein BRC94_04535 [Halobacteriales archaeon QS_5_70_17]
MTALDPVAGYTRFPDGAPRYDGCHSPRSVAGERRRTDTDFVAPFRGAVGWLDADEPTHRGALWGLAITGLAAATVAVAGTVRGSAPAVALPLV